MFHRLICARDPPHKVDPMLDVPVSRLLWHGTDPRAIPFDRLPAEYVIKPNRAAIIRTVAGWLADNYYWQGRELQAIRPLEARS